MKSDPAIRTDTWWSNALDLRNIPEWKQILTLTYKNIESTNDHALLIELKQWAKKQKMILIIDPSMQANNKIRTKDLKVHRGIWIWL